MKKVFLTVLVLILILAIVGGGIYIGLFRQAPTKELSTLYNGFRFISEGDLQNIGEGQMIEGQAFLSLDYIKNNIDDSVFYDEAEKTVIFTNKDNVRRYKLDDVNGTVNEKPINLRTPITEIDGKIMIPQEAFAYDYPIDFRYVEEEDLLIMDRTDTEYISGFVKKDGASLRDLPDKAAPLIKNLNKDDELIIYAEDENYYKAREVNGRVGYISKKEIEVNYKFEEFNKKIDRGNEELDNKEAQEKINLVWDYTSIKQSNVDLKNLVGVNTMSPTWFSLGEDLSIIDRSNQDYKIQYNNIGKAVWPMFDNNFDSELTHRALSSSSNRQRIINDIYEICRKNNYEGINIDFENLKIETRDYFTQFVRELYPLFRESDILVSVDVIPRIYTDVSKEQYDRLELAKTSDYIVLMAYDQHWSSSPTAGSVAEYKWVESNLNVLFRSIPTDKFILGVPLYTRVWFDDGETVTSQSVDMETANRFINDNSIEMYWDNGAKQHVGITQQGDKTISIWLEDRDSLVAKSSLVNKYNLAGLASWRLGFETQDIWPAISENL